MTAGREIPQLVGLGPAEAEAAAAAAGFSIAWRQEEAPRWLSPRHEPRVGRQRLRADDVLELLIVLIPSLPEER